MSVIQHPIRIDKNTVAAIHIFTRNDNISDLWFGDDEQWEKENYELKRSAARMFFKQLEGRASMRFMMALRDELDKDIKKWQKERK